MPCLSKGPNYLDWSEPIWTFPKSFWTYSRRRHNLYVFEAIRIFGQSLEIWTIVHQERTACWSAAIHRWMMMTRSIRSNFLKKSSLLMSFFFIFQDNYGGQISNYFQFWFSSSKKVPKHYQPTFQPKMKSWRTVIFCILFLLVTSLVFKTQCKFSGLRVKFSFQNF